MVTTSRLIRYEEYASSGDTSDNLSIFRPPPNRLKKNPSGNNSANMQYSHRANDAYLGAFDTVRVGQTTGEQKKGPISIPSISCELRTISEGDWSGSWVRGPKDAEGCLSSVSDRPLTCLSMNDSQSHVVAGSTDHALYVVPIADNDDKRRRGNGCKKLYTKKCGHSEWVTGALYLSDDRIVSAAMDSRLCLWNASGTNCEDLIGHAGSITLVKNLARESSLVFSAGYDKTVRVWNVGKQFRGKTREIGCIKATSAPILDADTQSAQKITVGDRDGNVRVIDLEKGTVVQAYANAHRGHTTSILGSCDNDRNGIYSGGQDGIVNVWDCRQKKCLASLELHTDKKEGKAGAVGFLAEPSHSGGENILITGGADGTINVLDKRQSHQVVHKWIEHQDYIYSLHVSHQLCFSGDGQGMLHVHDWRNGHLLYGLGANQAAIRAITTSDTKLVVAGDDGSILTYDMSGDSVL